MNKERKTGFYWVKLWNDNWIVVEFSGALWGWQGCSFDDNAFKEIDERMIVRNEI
jgi:hypothetical protein